MSEDLPKHELLRKLGNMTTSPNDGEALTAIRKFNKLLTEGGWTWDQLLAGKIRLIGDPWKGMAAPPSTPAASRVQPQAPRPQAPRPQPKPQPQPAPPPTYMDLDGDVWPSQWQCDQQNTIIRNQRAVRARAAKPTIASTKSNAFDDYCYCCGTYVGSGKGWIFHPNGTSGKWRVACDPCNKSTAPIPARPAQRITPTAYRLR